MGRLVYRRPPTLFYFLTLVRAPKKTISVPALRQRLRQATEMMVAVVRETAVAQWRRGHLRAAIRSKKNR